MTITPKERQRLLKFGGKLGKALRSVVTIVQPDTFLRWIREEKKSKKKKTPAERGRRRKALLKNAYRAPNTNAYVERFIQSLQQECLDKFIIFAAKHCNVLVREYLAYYLTERPHQGVGIDNNPLNLKRKRGRPKTDRGKIDDQIVPLGEVRCKQRLGGLLKSYQRAA